ncbi:MAG TPA: hypothetical protein PKC67_02390 [Kiritimatiellia bacterium]|nr:hypothetical protein [Kiritimatiellia bacterium]HMP33174.1 hypothetical protein [Kiritimatiellia bacterium]
MNDKTDKPTTRKGNVARLPFEIREQLNAMIRDGAPASDLNAFLESKGLKKLNDQNWTNWRKGGYKDWLKEQAYLDTVREKHETIRRELEAGGFSILDKAIFDVASQLADSDLEPTKVASAISSLKFAVDGSRRTAIADRRAQLAEQALALQQKKFERETCKLFLKWYTSEKAKEIAEGKATNTVKVDQLRQLIFGRPPDASAAD